MIPIQTPFVLELAAQEFAESTSESPFFLELEPTAARSVVDLLRAASIGKPPIDEEWISVPTSLGDERVRIVKLRDTTAARVVLVYMHGGGWVYMHGGGWVLGNRLSAAAQCRAGFLTG